MWPSLGLCPSYLIKPTLLQDLSTVTQTTKLIKTFQAAAGCGYLGLPLYMSCFLTPTYSKLDAARQAMQPGSGKWQRVCSNLLPSQPACSPTVLLSLTHSVGVNCSLITELSFELLDSWGLYSILTLLPQIWSEKTKPIQLRMGLIYVPLNNHMVSTHYMRRNY